MSVSFEFLERERDRLLVQLEAAQDALREAVQDARANGEEAARYRATLQTILNLAVDKGRQGHLDDHEVRVEVQILATEALEER